MKGLDAIMRLGIIVVTTGGGDVKIVVDAGHGGRDPGAVGYVGESDVTLRLAKLVAYELRLGDCDVTMTRSTDDYVSLRNRVKVANMVKPDLFVSLHCNAAISTSANGVETLCYKSRSTAYMYAQKVQAELAKHTEMMDRGVKITPWLYVLRHTTCPAIMVELGFVTNTNDAFKLKNPQFIQQAARLITRGITK